MRAFLAITLDVPAQGQLMHLLDALQAAEPPMPLRWSTAAQQHCTLHFLGEIAPTTVQNLQRLLPPLLGAWAPFALTFECLGCFPHSRQPQVLWLGVSDPRGSLPPLHAALSAVLEPLGYTPEDRPFTPHLTLARVPRAAKVADVRALGTWFSTQAPPAPYTMRVSTVHLMQSEPLATGARYTSVIACPLLGEPISPLSPLPPACRADLQRL